MVNENHHHVTSYRMLLYISVYPKTKKDNVLIETILTRYKTMVDSCIRIMWWIKPVNGIRVNNEQPHVMGVNFLKWLSYRVREGRFNF